MSKARQKIIIAISILVQWVVLSACITSIDESLPYDELPQITLATDVTLVASPSHPSSYLGTEAISAGTKLAVLGQDANAAWLLVEHNSMVGWMPSFYSQTNIGASDSAFTFDLLPDSCTKFMGATFSPTESWASTAAGTITVVGSILHSADTDAIADLSLQIEIDGQGQAVEADYVHVAVDETKSVILFGFTLAQIADGSEVSFQLTAADQIDAFQAAFFINTCTHTVTNSNPEFIDQLPIRQQRVAAKQSQSSSSNESSNEAQLPPILQFSGERGDAPISSPVESLAWSPDGTYFAAGTDEGIVGIWQADNGTLLHSFEGHFAAISVLEWSPNGQFLASGSRDGVIRIWNMEKGQALYAVKSPRPARVLQTVTIAPTTVISFQDEGTAGTDDTKLLLAQDEQWAPSKTGSATADYYATGDGSDWFDALSANFNLRGKASADYTITLRFYAQHGSYRDSFWNHYILQRGKENQEENDSTPPTKVAGAQPIDFTKGKWLEIDVPPSYWTNDDLWLTLRLWNVRVDAVELQLSPK